MNGTHSTAATPPSWSWTFVEIAVLTFPVVVVLAPNVEEGRMESRYRQTRADCVRLTEDLSKQECGPPFQARVVTLEERDPFGQPYLARIEPSSSAPLRVFSCGPDAESNSLGLDPDDMSLDMRWTQLDTIRQRRSLDWWIAFGSWAVLCGLGTFLVRKNHQSPVLQVGGPQ